MDIGVWQLGAALVRALTYAATLGAAGMAFFFTYAPVREVARPIAGLALAAVLLTLCRFPLLAAALGGADHLFDPALLRLVAHSGEGTGALLRVLGFGLICAGLANYRGHRGVLAAGALLAALSFAASGHVHARHSAVSSGLLALHLAGAAFWLGALWPLAHLLRIDPVRGARAVARFSQRAVLVVPLLLAAGLLMLMQLLGSADALWTTRYGRWLCVKLLLVAALLGVAALNRLRLTPRLGEPGGRANLQRALRAEIALAAGVLAVTAGLTTFAGPHD